LKPVIRISGMATRPFQNAATMPNLHRAFDQLVGPGRWRARQGLLDLTGADPTPVEQAVINGLS